MSDDDADGLPNELIDSPWVIAWEDAAPDGDDDPDAEPDAAYQIAAFDREDAGRA